MYNITFDLAEVENLSAELRRVESERIKNLSAPAHSATRLIKDRIQKGKTASGVTMVTKAKFTTGRYSKTWGNIRKKKKLITRVINLNFTGSTIKAFKNLGTVAADSVDVGFSDSNALQIAEWNQSMFGNAYDLNDKEIEDGFELYLSAFNSDLTKR